MQELVARTFCSLSRLTGLYLVFVRKQIWESLAAIRHLPSTKADLKGLMRCRFCFVERTRGGSLQNTVSTKSEGIIIYLLCSQIHAHKHQKAVKDVQNVQTPEMYMDVSTLSRIQPMEELLQYKYACSWTFMTSQAWFISCNVISRTEEMLFTQIVQSSFFVPGWVQRKKKIAPHLNL